MFLIGVKFPLVCFPTEWLNLVKINWVLIIADKGFGGLRFDEFEA